MLTFAPGAISVASWESYLRASDPAAPMLGDAKDWGDLDQMGSIFVGSPETVRQRLWEYIRDCRVGIFLMQFHVGNLPYHLTLRSQRLFATRVMPGLKRDSAELFAREFPELAAAR